MNETVLAVIVWIAIIGGSVALFFLDAWLDARSVRRWREWAAANLTPEEYIIRVARSKALSEAGFPFFM